MKQFLLVVPCYKCFAFCKLCIESILNSDSNHKLYDLLIIDNGSNNGQLTAYLKEMKNKENVYVIENEMNRGVSGAFNQGIDKFIEGKYEYLGLLNSDTVYQGSWLEKIQEAFDKYDVNMVAPMVSNHDLLNDIRTKNPVKHGTLVDSLTFDYLKNILNAMYDGNFEGKCKELEHKFNDRTENAFTFCCGFLNDTIIKSVGYFNEYFFPGMLEDTNYIVRAELNNVLSHIRLCNVIVHHWCSVSIKKLDIYDSSELQEKHKKNFREISRAKFDCLRHSCKFNKLGVCDKGLTEHYLPTNKCQEYEFDKTYHIKCGKDNK